MCRIALLGVGLAGYMLMAGCVTAPVEEKEERAESDTVLPETLVADAPAPKGTEAKPEAEPEAEPAIAAPAPGPAEPAVTKRESGKGPLKVFILVGQSNMQGHAHINTLDVMKLDPSVASIYSKIRNPDGSYVTCDDVYISCIGCSDEEKFGKLKTGYGAEKRGPKIGPEYTFGIYMREFVGEPILIIKTAWGGKSLSTDFRPPNAGPYEWSEAAAKGLTQEKKDKKVEATGVYYRLMLEHVKKVLADIKSVYPDYDAEQGYEIAGFVWFQGWNDLVDRGTYPRRHLPGGYDAYTEVLRHFIRDVRRDLSAPDMKFVIGVMGVGGKLENHAPRYRPIHGGFRKAMAAAADLPEFESNVAAVNTADYWDEELSEIRWRNGKVKEKRKELDGDKSLTPEQRKAVLKQFEDQLYTDRERQLLKGASNFDFHYMGCGKIMARIGKGFAEAMLELMENRAGR